MTHIIIGSGPSGISAARALLDRGIKVTMLDGGKTLEAHLANRQGELASGTPADWTPEQISSFQNPQFSTPAGQARRYGSDFAMEPGDATLAQGTPEFGLRSSRAAGGLSNLWGSAVLPYQGADIANWPVGIDELQPHYSAVAEFMPVAAKNDGLDALFPAFPIAKDTSLKPGVQASEILNRLGHAKSDGIQHGQARNAVSTACIGCGMCLHGCPWGHIYSTKATLAQLKTDANFTYQPGAKVVAYEESADSVLVHLENGPSLTGTRLFLAAGVLETVRILLNSAPHRGQKMTLLDSQQILLPLLHRWRTPQRPDTAPLNTLPQIFVEIDDASVSPHLVHSQIYTWNEHFARDLIENYGFGLKLTHPILRALARRLIVAQLFLHSDHSARVDLTLAKNGKLNTVLHENPETTAVLKRAQKKLGRALSGAGLSMLGFAGRAGQIGSSFHSGGTVPMARNPQSGQSDILGRPKGLNRVHIVDSSVFPSIPATTITFSVMANAHRIACNTPD